MSNESIKPPTTSNKMLNPSLDFVGTKARVKFSGDCLKQEKITFNHGKTVSIYIVYEIEKSVNISSYSTLENSLFGAVKLAKHVDVDQYKYPRYGTRLDRKRFFSHPSGRNGKNVIIFGVDMSSSTKIDNGKKVILIPGKGLTQGLEHNLVQKKCIQLTLLRKYKVLFKLAL